jgi:predicted dienelactone hydrolase
MVSPALRFAGVALLALAAAAAPLASRAGVGVMQLDGPVTVFYPTAAADQPTVKGPFTMALAENATPIRGNGRLVVISHGSGGTPWVHSDLARALVGAGFIVAFPWHAGDNAQDPGKPGPDSWKQRPAEVSQAIDRVGRSPVLASLLSLERVGMYGMSAGGHTALSMAGGRWSPAGYAKHCEANIEQDFHSCLGLMTQLDGGVLDAAKVSVGRFALSQLYTDARWQVHADPRIAAVVAGVPYAADFDMESLATPRVPLGLVTVGADLWLPARFHSDRVLAACQPRCTLLAHLPDAGHGALLSPPPPADRLGKVAARLLLDPPGFDRAQMADVDKRIASFFRRHLVGLE